MARRPTTRSGRRAFTLVEVVLVLVVLALIAAVAWPSLQRSLADHRLRNAADMIRADWARARAEAMASGVAQRFRYALDEQTYWIEPCEDLASSAGERLSTDEIARPNGSSEFDRSRLPKDIAFVEGELIAESSEETWTDSTALPEDGETLMSENGESEPPIVFLPDGTCSSARLVLQNEYDRGIAVKIRGLTAISTVGQVFYIEEGLP